MERVGQRNIYARGGITKWYWDIRDRAILKHTESVLGSIIDVGCGEGITLEKVIAQDKNRFVLGIDSDPGSVFASRRLPVVRGNANMVPGMGWSCCLLIDVIEHLSRPMEAIRSIFQSLSPDGKLILMFPNDRLFFWSRLACLKFSEAFSDHGHKNRFDVQKMKWMLEKSGFMIGSIERVPCSVFPLHYLIVARKPHEDYDFGAIL